MSVYNDLEVLHNFYGVTTTKGDVIINDGSKNNRLPISTDTFIMTADSTQPLGVRWSDPRYYSINYSQVTLTTLPISTNSQLPVPITQFQLTPPPGKYCIFYNATFAMSSVISRTTSFGVYINGVLAAGSLKILTSSAIGVYTNFNTQFIVTLGGTDIVSIKYNVSNNDTTVDIKDGGMVTLKFSTELTYNG